MRNFRKMPFSEIAATAPPERVVLFLYPNGKEVMPI